MKSQHFCTPGLLHLIKIIMHNEGMSEWEDFRTFWVPNFEEGDVIQVKERIEREDYPLCKAEIVSILPVQYKDIDLNIVANQEQIDRYKRKFHPGHWFFKIKYRIVRDEKRGLDRFTS